MLNEGKREKSWWLGLVGVAIALQCNPASAQVVGDTNLPAGERSQVSSGPLFQIDGGARRGSNLFHSFQQFSVPTGGTAFFNNAPDIVNIISRVTGTSASRIDGLIQANGKANLFLLNPNGIIFGPNASLNIGGSFLATTANAIQFGNQGVFSATNPNNPQLLTVNPSALLFNQIVPSSINSQAKLQVPTTQSLLLVGGNVNLDGGSLLAPGGRVELGGVAGTGTVGLNIDGSNLSLSFPDIVARADVSLTGGTEVNVRAGDGGSIAINARNLNLSQASLVRGGIESGLGSPQSKAGDIEINASGAVNLSDTSIISNEVRPDAVGNGGDVRITTGSLSATDGSQVRTYTFGQGDAGSVRITASDTVSLDGVNSNGRPSAARSLVNPGGVGNSGGVFINTGSLFVTNGAELNASVLDQGRGTGGGITINARDKVVFNGGFAYSRLEEGGVGKAGDIRINTGSLLLTGIPKDVADDIVGQVVTATFGQGDAGSVMINARDAVTLDGRGSEIWTLVAEERGVGNGGDIIINSGSLSLSNGVRLFSGVENLGNGGKINITTGRFSVTDSKILSLVYNGGKGNAGDINITALSLNIISSSLLSSVEEGGQGKAGNVNINVRGPVVMDGGGQGNLAAIVSYVKPKFSNITGIGGNISIKADSLSLMRGVEIATGVGDNNPVGKASGDGGNINIQVGNALNLSQSFIDSRVFANGTGNAGNIDIQAGSVSLYQSVISASTGGQGNAGGISVRAANGIRLADSDISTAVQPGATGNANGINISAPVLSLTDGAQLNTITSGEAKAGDIHINAVDRVSVSGTNTINTPANLFQTISPLYGTAPDFVDGVQSGIFTSSNSSGVGGNITVKTSAFKVADGAVVDARTTASGPGGTIRVDTKTFEATSGGQLIAITSGAGTGGAIALHATDRVTISGSDPTYRQRLEQFASQTDIYGKPKVGNIGPTSGLFVNATANSTGNGGNINIDTTNMNLTNGAQVSAQSQGTGKAGSIAINTQGTLQANDGKISTSSAQSSGGEITITAKDMRLGNSDITTSVFRGEGGGGNINLTSRWIVALKDSDILAFSRDGRGGNITLNTPVFFGRYKPAPLGTDPATLDGNNRVDINATGGISSGTITLPDVTPLQRSLNQLPTDAIDTNSLLANSCIMRSPQQRGSFTITGSGGLPRRPNDPANGSFETYTLVPTPNTHATSSTSQNMHPNQFVEAQGIYRLANGQLVLGRECSHSGE